jgi:hypothetical protein
MKKTPLTFMPYAQAGTVQEGQHIALISYKTHVCGVVDNQAYCYGTFSRTTMRHIGAFAKQVGQGLSYHIFKKCWRLNAIYRTDLKCFVSIETGEILE